MLDQVGEMSRQDVARPIGSMGIRVRAARERANLTQTDLSTALGFSDRQTLSAIENGERRIQAAELVKISQVLQRSLDWFVDPFVVEGEARFSWRVAQSVPDEVLGSFESSIGRLVGLFRHLRRALNGPSEPIAPMLRLPSHPTFEDAWSLGESIAEYLKLGVNPSHDLVSAIEHRLDIPILYVDVDLQHGAREISGAMCRLADFEVIVVNRQESSARRNFDVAHELFHALTWDAMPPDYREDPDQVSEGKRTKRIEQLADNFAAALLMPKVSLDKLIPKEHLSDPQYLSEVARELHVSTGALAFRLLNAQMIDKTTCTALRSVPTSKDRTPPPRLLSDSFAGLLHDGIARGHVSARKAASTLSMTLDQLAGTLKEHGKPVPFEI